MYVFVYYMYYACTFDKIVTIERHKINCIVYKTI